MTAIDAVRPMPWHGLFHRLAAGRTGAAVRSANSLRRHCPRRPIPIRPAIKLNWRCCSGACRSASAMSINSANRAAYWRERSADYPLLLVRDRDGSIGVFLNSCRHRGARLVTEDGVLCHRSSLSCLYHGWTYDLSGALVSVPRREAFPHLTWRHAACGDCLQPYATASSGLCSILRSRTAPDMADYLGEIDVDLAALGLAGHHFFRQHAVQRAANWKLIVDAFIEFYHIKRLHAPPLAGSSPTRWPWPTMSGRISGCWWRAIASLTPARCLRSNGAHSFTARWCISSSRTAYSSFIPITSATSASSRLARPDIVRPTC